MQHSVAGYFKKFFIAGLLLVGGIFSTSAFSITNTELFTWAAATYPQFFSGTPSAGQYQQYTYQYYQSSHNYLAVDNAGGVYVLGPVSGNAILNVGTLTAFASTVTAWEATQVPTCTLPQVLTNGVCVTPTADFSGAWYGNYNGTAFTFSVTQTGNSLNMTRISPPAVGGYDGVISGNSAVVTSYINNVAGATSTLTLTNSTTANLVVTACFPPPGYSCAAPGSTLTLTRQ